jgi:hypothetical protein
MSRLTSAAVAETPPSIADLPKAASSLGEAGSAHMAAGKRKHDLPTPVRRPVRESGE